jgi:hypothetical protein
MAAPVCWGTRGQSQQWVSRTGRCEGFGQRVEPVRGARWAGSVWQQSVVAAEKLRRIAEVDARQAWRGEGARSTADLLTQRLRLTRGEA